MYRSILGRTRGGFTHEDIQRMRDLRAEGLTYNQIGREFAVTGSTIHRYVMGRKGDRRG